MAEARDDDVVVVQNVNIIASRMFQTAVGIAHEPQVPFVAEIYDAGIAETADDLIRFLGWDADDRNARSDSD